MSKLADANINSLSSSEMQADFVPPSEQLVTLTYGQLQDLVRGRIVLECYIHNAEKLTNIISSAMETFERAVELLPAGYERAKSSLREDLLKNGKGDPIEGIKIIQAHTQMIVEALQ